MCCLSYRGKKVKWSRYRPGVAQRVGRGIALLFHDRGIRRGWVVSSMPRPHFTPGKDPIPILQEAGWAPGLVWMGGKSRPHRDLIPDQSVAIPTELPSPLRIGVQLFNTLVYLNLLEENKPMIFPYCLFVCFCPISNFEPHDQFARNITWMLNDQEPPPTAMLQNSLHSVSNKKKEDTENLRWEQH